MSSSSVTKKTTVLLHYDKINRVSPSDNSQISIQGTTTFKYDSNENSCGDSMLKWSELINEENVSAAILVYRKNIFDFNLSDWAEKSLFRAS